MDTNNPQPNEGGLLQSRWRPVLLGFLIIAGFLLITEHTAHFFGVLPFLLLFCCALMMLFMHGGHGGDSSEHADHTGRQSMGGPD